MHNYNVDALALLELSQINVDEAAALSGLTTAGLAAQLDDEDTAAKVHARAVQMRLSGEALELAAMAALAEAIEKLRAIVADPETPPSAVIRATAELRECAALRARAAARLGAATNLKLVTPIQLNLNFGGDPAKKVVLDVQPTRGIAHDACDEGFCL